MKKQDMSIVIEEIARVALGMVFTEIGEELDLSDEYLLEVRDYLEAQEQEDHNMETYRVGIHFEEGQVLTVEAESKEAAEKIAMDAAELFGGTEYPKKFNQDGVHREFCVTHIEEQDQ